MQAGPTGEPGKAPACISTMHSAATDLATLTLREATARGFRPTVVHTQLALARVLALAGEAEPARTALQEAAALAKQLGLRREEVEARASLASVP
jgi:hypothetical protein